MPRFKPFRFNNAHRVLRGLLVACLLGLAVIANADDRSANNFAVRDVRVFDGERTHANATVLVRDGRIAEIGAKVRVPDGIRVIEGKGRTLLPGLIDAHVHAWGNARRDALRFGVTSELDMLGDWNRLAEIKTQRESLAHTDEADLWSAGAAVTAPGGHGTQYGMAVPTLAADGDADAFIAARVAEGSDYIKLIVEDMSAYSATTRMSTLTSAQLARAIAATQRSRKIAVVHASLQESARDALQSGADGLVHVFADTVADDALVQLARQHKAFVVPTLSVIAGIAGSDDAASLAADPQLQPMLTAEQRDALKARFAGTGEKKSLLHALNSVRRLHAAGVPILAGTDAGNPGTTHGASMHGELALLVRAGLTPTQALSAATALPARVFGLVDRGRIASGLRADLILVDGDPTRDILATRSIVGIWKNGYPVERAVAKVSGDAAKIEPLPASAVRIADFEGDQISAAFGAGWVPTTDVVAGGKSVVTHARVAGGAASSKGALEISGEIKPGFAFPWAGVMFFPAAQAMQPVDASQRKELVFHVKGAGRTYQAMLFSGASAQAMPSMRSFVAGPEWTEVRLSLADFQGADLGQLRGIAFTAGQPAGAFSFQLDGVELR